MSESERESERDGRMQQSMRRKKRRRKNEDESENLTTFSEFNLVWMLLFNKPVQMEFAESSCNVQPEFFLQIF